MHHEVPISKTIHESMAIISKRHTNNRLIINQLAHIITSINRSRHLLPKWRQKARTVKCRQVAMEERFFVLNRMPLSGLEPRGTENAQNGVTNEPFTENERNIPQTSISTD